MYVALYRNQIQSTMYTSDACSLTRGTALKDSEELSLVARAQALKLHTFSAGGVERVCVRVVDRS
jgi:hypothetical protein